MRVDGGPEDVIQKVKKKASIKTGSFHIQKKSDPIMRWGEKGRKIKPNRKLFLNYSKEKHSISDHISYLCLINDLFSISHSRRESKRIPFRRRTKTEST